MRTVAIKQLARHGVTLKEPEAGVAVRISLEEAEEAASAHFGGAKVRETALEWAMTSHRFPPIRCLCYAVSLEPGSLVGSEGGPGAPHMKASYLVAFVDANTGEFVFAIDD